MSHLLALGAINKTTREYTYPKIANKKDNYICPECHKDLILCKGEIIAPYFRHKVDVSPCNHYSNPTESQIHKDAKMVIKTLIEQRNEIKFVRQCCACYSNCCYTVPKITETSSVVLEYRFKYNGHTRSADVAFIDGSNIVCIIEICHTHRTSSTYRPEPWYEIDAKSLIKNVNESSSSLFEIQCIRQEKCQSCIDRIKQSKINKVDKTSIEYQLINNDIDYSPLRSEIVIMNQMTKEKMKLSKKPYKIGKKNLGVKKNNYKLYINGICHFYESQIIVSKILDWYNQDVPLESIIC
jgi:hypothetical protein